MRCGDRFGGAVGGADTMSADHDRIEAGAVMSVARMVPLFNPSGKTELLSVGEALPRIAGDLPAGRRQREAA